MMAKERAAPILFRGSPQDLLAVVHDTGLVRIQVPRTTPPGRYETEVKLGDVTHAAVLEVEPDLELEMIPKLLRLSGGADDTISRTLTIVNHGNVTVDLPSVGGFGLFERGGLDRAIGEELRSERGGEGSPLDRIAERVRDSHGGLARLHVDEGSGALEPGEAREIRITLHLPGHLRPGRVYTGLWSFYSIRYYIEVTVTGKAS